MHRRQEEQDVADGFKANQQNILVTNHEASGYAPRHQWKSTDLKRASFPAGRFCKQKIEWGHPALHEQAIEQKYFLDPGQDHG
jgi:hypothetical protein